MIWKFKMIDLYRKIISNLLNRLNMILTVPAIVIILIACLLPAVVHGEELKIQNIEKDKYPLIKMGFSLINKGETLDNRRISFYENGKKIKNFKIEGISTTEEPSAIALIIDTSGSMKGEPIESARTAARLFIDQMGERDRVSVISFNTVPAVLSEFTGDKNKLYQAVDRLQAGGDTAVYDGVSLGTDLIKSEPARQRNIVLLSDGADTASKMSGSALIDKVVSEKVPIYTIALQSGSFDISKLTQISEGSGGGLIIAPNAESLISFYDRLAKELKNQYLISYRSNEKSKKVLNLKITVEDGIGSTSAESRVEIDGAREPVKRPVEKVQRRAQSLIISKYGLPVVLTVSFLAAAFLIFATVSLFVPDKNVLREQLKIYERLGKVKAGGSESAGGNGDLKNKALELIGYLAAKRGFTDYANAKLEQAGIPLKLREYIFFHFLFVSGLSIAALIITGSLFISTILIIIAVGSPLMFVRYMIERRRRLFYNQLPDILNMLSSSLKAGYGLLQAIDLVAKEAEPPMSQEFKRVLNQTRLGMSLDEALNKMAERINNESFHWTVLAINIQKESGGNLAEILQILSDTIREREGVKRQIKALTAEGRLSAAILYVLPFLQGLLMFYINPSYMSLLFTHVAGWILIIFASMMMIVGAIWLKSIISIEV